MKKEWMFASIEKYLPLFILFLFWFVFSSPYFIHHLIPYPGDQLVNNYAPWSDYGVSPGPIKNLALSDVVTQLFPWKKLTIDAYLSGHLPLWNAYEFSGDVLAGNYQAAVFTPFNLLFFIFPFVTAWSLLILLQPLIAGVGTYLFVSHLTKNKYAGAFSGMAFMFSGFITVWMEYGTLAMSASMLPWILFSLEKLQEKNKIKWVVLGAVSVACSFLSGHFQTALYVCGFACIYALIFCNKNIRLRLHTLALFFLGILFALPQLLSTVSVFSQSVRSGDIFTDAGIPWWYILTVVIPDFFGNPTKRSDWVGHYAEWASFIGVVPFVFAFLAGKDKKHVRFFQITGLGAMLLALKTPLLSLLAYSHLPVLSSSYPTRIIVLFSFSLCVLAGIGFTRVWEGELLRRKAIIVISSCAVVLLACWIGGYLFLPRDKVIIALRNLVYPSSYFILTALALGIAYQVKKSSLKQVSLFVCILLAGVQGLLFSQQWNPFTPMEKIYPHLSVIQKIQQNLHGGRIYGTMSNAVYSYYHIPSVEGYDPIYSQRYADFIRASDPHAGLGIGRSVVTFNTHGNGTDRLLSFLGVTLLYQPISHQFQPWAYPSWEKGSMWEQVYEDSSARLYKNTEAMNIATLFCSYSVISDKKQLLDTFYKKDFPYRLKLLLETNPKHSFGTYCDSVSGTANIVENTTDGMRIEVNSTTPALLFVSQNYFTSWSAKVNGRTADIYPADLAFMAIEVPNGKSLVEFKQRLF